MWPRSPGLLRAAMPSLPPEVNDLVGEGKRMEINILHTQAKTSNIQVTDNPEVGRGSFIHHSFYQHPLWAVPGTELGA